VELSPETCRVKPLRRINATVASCWIYFTIISLYTTLRGIRFRTVPEILQALDRSIRTIKTTGATEGILRLPHRWQRVVHNTGDYIEKQ